MPKASEVASELKPEVAQMRHAAFVADVCFALATGTQYPGEKPILSEAELTAALEGIPTEEEAALLETAVAE